MRISDWSSDVCSSDLDENGNCGSVAFLEHIVHPVSVARKVMEDTPHVMLVGEGALQFALSKGFTKNELLTPEAETAWRSAERRVGKECVSTCRSREWQYH